MINDSMDKFISWYLKQEKEWHRPGRILPLLLAAAVLLAYGVAIYYCPELNPANW